MNLITALIAIFAAIALAVPPVPGEVLTEDEYTAYIQTLHPDRNWTMVVPEGGPEIGPRAMGGMRYWRCDDHSGVKDNQHAALRQVHKDFNKLFGEPRLTTAHLQSYVGTCRGYTFALNNRSCCTRKEVANARNLAAARDPGRYTLCVTSHFDDVTQQYYFLKGNPLRWDYLASRRYC